MGHVTGSLQAEAGTNTPTLLARSRHASVRSLERYARPGVDAVAQDVAQTTPLPGAVDPDDFALPGTEDQPFGDWCSYC